MTTEIKQCWRVGSNVFDSHAAAVDYARKQSVRYWIAEKMDRDILITDAESVAQWIVDNYADIVRHMEETR